VTLAASALGAILFGRVADILGRERIYGFEVLILAIGALASALAPNLIFLIVWVPSRGSASAATTRSQRPS
jgi:PHS family inorganic phosphate transporter-like MFS transporter